MGGKANRRKGHDFERDVANDLRARWPSAIIRRASQGERADNPDCFVDSGPALLKRMWLEGQCSVSPRPLDKLSQAERDVLAWHAARPDARPERLPVVVWHRTGERTSYVTTRLWVLDAMRGQLRRRSDMPITMPWPAFLDELAACVERVERESADG